MFIYVIVCKKKEQNLKHLIKEITLKMIKLGQRKHLSKG